MEYGLKSLPELKGRGADYNPEAGVGSSVSFCYFFRADCDEQK